jgi:dethiobiotin synthetase
MKIFVTGISTDVGKTIASAILVKALEADYWKPVQAGDLDFSDSDKLRKLVGRGTIVHPNGYALNTPASPHLAAEIDGISIDVKKIAEPETKNHLVIEGAGGVLVPLNETETIADLIRPDYKVIVVSRHYLGSINHTLLTLEYLKSRGIAVGGIIFNGDENLPTESIITSKTNVPVIGRIEPEPYFDDSVIADYADRFRDKILSL